MLKDFLSANKPSIDGVNVYTRLDRKRESLQLKREELQSAVRALLIQSSQSC